MFNFKLKSISGRIFLGKVIGLIIGLIVIIILPSYGFPLISEFGVGALIMFVLMGATIGFAGIFNRHPVLDFKMHWWFRGPAVGFVFYLMFVLLSYENINILMQSDLVSWTGLVSPYWALLDGIVIGAIMGFVETKFAGEGSDLPLK